MLQHFTRWADGAFREAREAERAEVERRLAVHEDLSHQAAGDRAHGEAVPAESRGEDEAAGLRHFSEDGERIRGRVDVAGPAPFDPQTLQGREEPEELVQALLNLLGVWRRVEVPGVREGMPPGLGPWCQGRQVTQQRAADVELE